jgi:hypothetical protein
MRGSRTNYGKGRTTKLTVRLTGEELEKLRGIVRSNESMQDAIRRLIKESK